MRKFLLATAACCGIIAAAPGWALTGKVVGVADGDTITVLSDTKKQTKVRLASIDAPEKGMPFGTASKIKLSDLVFGKTVYVSEDTKDKYGRTVGLVEVGSINVNHEMVRTGMAWTYTQYMNRRDATFPAAQVDAQASHKGLWADAKPTAPWDWRHGTTEQKVDLAAAEAAMERPTLIGGTCKSFNTCGEAKRSLKSGNTKLDRDGDGVPCESICR